MVLRQIDERRSEVENQYSRIVPPHGNAVALDAIGKVFELREFFEWRGLGSIDHSGVRIREPYAAYDAERRFKVPDAVIADPKACQCGEVLKGVLKPWGCKVFGSDCTPETPMGALMVSSEGACAAYYRFGDLEKIHLKQVASRPPETA
jgi:hydrogenase expression/formation protein HypD